MQTFEPLRLTTEQINLLDPTLRLTGLLSGSQGGGTLIFKLKLRVKPLVYVLLGYALAAGLGHNNVHRLGTDSRVGVLPI